MTKKIGFTIAGLIILALTIVTVWALARPGSPAGIMGDDATHAGANNDIGSEASSNEASSNEASSNEADECPSDWYQMMADAGICEDFMRNQSSALVVVEYIYEMFPREDWRAIYPQFFGGLYLNDDGHMVVMIVEDMAADSETIEFLTRVEGAGGAILRYVEFPWQLLLDLSDVVWEAIDDLGQDHPLSRNVRGWGPDTIDNRLTVRLLDDAPDQKAQFNDQVLDHPALVLYSAVTQAILSPVPVVRVHPQLVDVTMATTDICHDTSTVVVTIYNESAYTISTGYPFSLEVYDNGEWWQVPGDLMFILPAFDVTPGGSIDFTKRLSEGFVPLQPGRRYRIRKDVLRFTDTPVNDSNTHDIFAEFYWE